MKDKKIPNTNSNEKYERFYYKYKKRLFNGEEINSASRDAPDGFQEWLKKGIVK